jgi:hypothetical protein
LDFVTGAGNGERFTKQPGVDAGYELHGAYAIDRAAAVDARVLDRRDERLDQRLGVGEIADAGAGEALPSAVERVGDPGLVVDGDYVDADGYRADGLRLDFSREASGDDDITFRGFEGEIEGQRRRAVFMRQAEVKGCDVFDGGGCPGEERLGALGRRGGRGFVRGVVAGTGEQQGAEQEAGEQSHSHHLPL